VQRIIEYRAGNEKEAIQLVMVKATTIIKAALNANYGFVERSNVTFYCYLGILHPLLSPHDTHSCHFSGTILSAPNTLPGRHLVCPQTGSRETDSLLTSYSVTWGYFL
jgi:hypothetical protein